MWVFLNDAFLSIVQSDRDPALFAVRARKLQDLERCFPGYAPVPARRGADYAWRVFVPKHLVQTLLLQRLSTLDYTNFKGSIDDRLAEGEERHDAYLAVWGAMVRWQDGLFKRGGFHGRAKASRQRHRPLVRTDYKD